MKKFTVCYSNYQTQCIETIPIICENDDEAHQLGLKYIDAQFPSHAPHDKDVIEQVIEIGEISYLNKDDIEQYVLKCRERTLNWFKNIVTDNRLLNQYVLINVRTEKGVSYMSKYNEYLVKIITDHKKAVNSKATKTMSYTDEIIYCYDITKASCEIMIEIFNGFNFNKIDSFNIQSSNKWVIAP